VPFERFDDAQAERFLKILFILQFWYIIAVALVKLSILFLYGRVFGIGRFPISVLTLIGITTSWLISFLFATFFQVWPLKCNWVACIPTTDYAVMYMLSSVTDIVIDICILGLPAFFIRKLHLNGNQKIGLIGIFGLGIFCVVSSIARLAYTILFHNANIKGNYAVNFSSNVVNIIMWSGIEVCASTLCASLPCFGPLINHFHHITPFTATTTSFMSIGTNAPTRTTSKGASMHSPYASRENILGFETRTDNVINGASSRDTSKGSEINIELGSIKVDNSVNINSL
jgi:hypothetical protein